MTPDMFGHAKIRPQAPVYCVYHKVDFDGECSAAIVHRNTTTCTSIPYNYEEPFPWAVFEQANRRPICYMVDVSLSMPDMKRLAGLSELVWIDHHKSKIDEALAANFNPPGVRDSKWAACELTWGHFHGNNAYMPVAVHLLGRYDAWDHKDPRVLPFQFWLRGMKSTTPRETDFWDHMFALREDSEDFSTAIAMGEWNMMYQEARDYKAIMQYGFETYLFGCKTLACNSLPGGSQLFTGHPSASDYQLFCMFYWRSGVGWTVSLYTTDPKIDCGDIARRMGGGGHRGAAGYTVRTLPEELQA